MIGFDDVIPLILLCAIVFIPAGYALNRRFPHGYQTWKNLLLSPRYLKSAGLWVREGSTSQIKRRK